MSVRAVRWLAAAALWASAIAAGQLAGGRSPASTPTGVVVSTSTLPAAAANSVAVTENGAVITANGVDPFVVLAPPARPVRSVRLDLDPRQSTRRDFYLYFVPAAAPAGTGFSEQHVLRGRVVSMVGGWRIEWELAEPVRAYRLDVPEDASFRTLAFAASERQGALATRPGSVARSAWLFLAAAMLALAGVQVAWRLPLPDDAAVKRLGIGMLLLPLGVILFLLPPFQGPDEGAHWKIALAVSRPAVHLEPSAYLLPDILDPVPMRFKPEVKFDAARLEIDEAGRPLTRAELDADQRTLHDNYPYSRFYAYPVVTALSLLYPRMERVGQAVLLFYLCRAVPALLLVGLLLLANRRYELPFTAIMFVSLPLVLQQSAIVSADVLLDLGALGCALLCLHHRERPDRGTAVALWLLALAIVGVKFIYAPLLLLPALTIPAGRPRRVAAVAAAVLGVALAYPAIRMVLHEVRAIALVLHRSALADQQIASLATIAGWTDLLAMYGRYVSALAHARAWSGPLGWLDTPLSEAHLVLIRGGVAAAVVLDLWRWAPVWRARARGVAFAIAFGIAGTAFATFVDVLLYFLMTTSPGAAEVAGVQVRHFFPIVIAALVLAAAPSAERAPERGTPVRLAALGIFVGLLVLRTVLLAQDLLARYW